MGFSVCYYDFQFLIYYFSWKRNRERVYSKRITYKNFDFRADENENGVKDDKARSIEKSPFHEYEYEAPYESTMHRIKWQRPLEMVLLQIEMEAERSGNGPMKTLPDSDESCI